MEILTVIVSVLGVLVGSSIIMNVVFYRSQSKRIKDAEASREETAADKAKFEAYEARLTACHENIHTLNDTVKEQGATIKSLNHALDDKTRRIRQLTDQLYDSEQTLNRVNARVADLEAELGRERLITAKYKFFHCRRNDCDDRIPLNKKLKNITWDSVDSYLEETAKKEEGKEASDDSES